MGIVDFILNLAALLLWLNWRAIPFNPVVSPSSSAALLTTLHKAGRSRRTAVFLAGCVLIVVVRAAFYRMVGPQLNWNPVIPLVLVSPVFRSDVFVRMLFFSTLSFLLTIALFYHSLLLLSVVNRRLPETDPVQRWVGAQLGCVVLIPGPIRLLVPFFAGLTGWCLLGPLLAVANLQPAARSFALLLQQGVCMGVATVFAWKYVVIGALILHLVNSYVYLGAAGFWNYVTSTNRGLLFPVSWLPLQAGRIDFSPIATMALVFLIGELPNTGWAQRWMGPLFF